LIRHNVSPFFVDALRVSPKTRKAQPELTDWAWLWFVAGWVPPASCLYMVNLTSFLFPGFSCNDFGQPCSKGACMLKLAIWSENLFAIVRKTLLQLKKLAKDSAPFVARAGVVPLESWVGGRIKTPRLRLITKTSILGSLNVYYQCC
jgi:hypothetical protein